MKVTNQDFYIDGFLKAALDTATKTIKKDWDMVFCVDGSEGSGKSVLAQQLAYYCDPTLTNTRVVFTPQEFRKAITNSDKYTAVIYDEAYTGLSSRATMSLINRTLISMLAEIRQRNLFVFVVMPCFFDLDKYVALWRSRGLFHVYTGKNFQRGFFAFYNTDRKKDLYIQGKKFYSYYKPKPNFIGRFTNHYTVDEKEYKKNKKHSLIAREKKADDAAKKKEIETELFSRLQELKTEVSHPLKIQIMGMSSATYFRKLRAYNDLKEFS
ncbi:MAG: hypothetical protein DRR04_05310 [Gammaproteobacteria bacterium]|nr:MAG: hypothetical protein DRQ97_06760 [Gammaproteobacteria bacterium]RLA60546.1 MAG: hypothetical protein DRR04_05310 [Gammaproteobacteria bacterium]